MKSGPIIEFITEFPTLLSSGHDGLSPYNAYPFDEIYVFAEKGAHKSNDRVDIILPYGNHLHIANHLYTPPIIKVHKSGCMWHDRTRDIATEKESKWLSIFGPTSVDPRKTINKKSLFVELPGNPSFADASDLIKSSKWREIKDLHTRNREWFYSDKSNTINIQKILKNDLATCIAKIDAANLRSPPKNIVKQAQTYERNRSLVKLIKKIRGSACQICGSYFIKSNGEAYSELHHLEHLSHSGLDISSNLLVLCANHHRQFHYGNIKIQEHTKNHIIVKIDEMTYICNL